MVVEKWNVQKVWTGTDKPWRAFAPAPTCRTLDHCRCRSFPTWAEAVSYARDEAVAVGL